VVLKSKELASLALTCLALSDFHEVSRAAQALKDTLNYSIVGNAANRSVLRDVH
jgi:hypothetical protein